MTFCLDCANGTKLVFYQSNVELKKLKRYELSKTKQKCIPCNG